MTISAKVIADSIGPYHDKRIITLQLRYPRFIHAEFMTHRMFSRNASSSRAVPVERLIQDIIDDTAMPIHWGKNQKGMQADEEWNNYVIMNEVVLGAMMSVPYTNIEAWLAARDRAISVARAFNEAGYHKQIVNRLLEPFSHINVVVTATDWKNFFALRIHKDAQPEICELAKKMKEAIDTSTPKLVDHNQWHLPYVDEDDWVQINAGGVVTPDQEEAMIKISVARCARVSYLTQDGKRSTVEQDLSLYDRLLGSHPLHASPAEHQATPTLSSVQSGNFRGWIQFRKTLAGENQE